MAVVETCEEEVALEVHKVGHGRVEWTPSRFGLVSDLTPVN